MKIGDNTYINGGVFSISENSKICIGNDCLISYNVHFRTVSHYYENKNELIRNQGEFSLIENTPPFIYVLSPIFIFCGLLI